MAGGIIVWRTDVARMTVLIRQDGAVAVNLSRNRCGRALHRALQIIQARAVAICGSREYCTALVVGTPCIAHMAIPSRDAAAHGVVVTTSGRLEVLNVVVHQF